MSERAAPFYCPYCGDEDLRPSEEEAPRGQGAAWECASCNRAFRLAFLGLLAKGLRRDRAGEGDTSI
ncbi:hypothetical protein [Streptomyces sp. BRA346]|uniref:hypothetical protein n=1 Tax=Streptomyces sp. BRA346 TaxID=2878199 RepID=UPI004063F27A